VDRISLLVVLEIVEPCFTKRERERDERAFVGPQPRQRHTFSGRSWVLTRNLVRPNPHVHSYLSAATPRQPLPREIRALMPLVVAC
jgi:hypothetical protein